MVESVNKCMMCDNTSNERTLISVEKQGEQGYICASCLPGVIHGAE